MTIAYTHIIEIARGSVSKMLYFLITFFIVLILDKEIDWKTVNLKKMKVKDLKKILDNWGETCDGCLEKTDYIKRIEELKPTYIKEDL